MSHNPNTVKSQDEVNQGGRKSDVLVEAISKLETTTKELERTKKQLEIADIALAEIEKNGTNPEIKTITALCVNNFLLAHKARKEIEELNK